jgi:hypothetical protein
MLVRSLFRGFLVAVFGISSCGSGGGVEEPAVGSVSVVLMSSFSAAHVKATVTGPGIESAQVVELTKTVTDMSEVWSAILKVPSGTKRNVLVKAMDGNGTIIYTGSTQPFDVPNGSTKHIVCMEGTSECSLSQN